MMPQGVSGVCEFGETVVRLRSGKLFTALAVVDAEERAAQLETVLKAVVDDATRVVWVGNPLRSLLTIERFLIQIVGPEVDLRIDRGPAELASLIARRDGSETRLLVIVQQPESINPETLEQLGAMAGHFDGECVPLQFLLVGTPALRLPNAGVAAPDPMPAHFEAGDWMVGAAPKWRSSFPKSSLILAVIIGAVVLLAPYIEGFAIPTAAEPLPPRVNLGETHPIPVAAPSVSEPGSERLDGAQPNRLGRP